MKKINNPGLLSIILAVLFSGYTSTQLAAQTPLAGTITYQTFYDNLSPYGTWIDYPNYGHVWHPRIDGEFRPYATNGNWAYSNEGWTWGSNYSWGWAAFHYGSWLYDDMYGWLWVPGYDWSPAWVTWGSVDDYYCWAPLMPGVNISLQFGSWRPNAFYWNICTRAHLYDRDLSGVLIRQGQANAIASHITIMNDFNSNRTHNYYAKGPDVHEVEKYVNRKIVPVSFKDIHAIGRAGLEGNTMKVYRPQVQNPQPHDFRRAEAGQINPVQAEGQRPSIERKEQNSNIDLLPRHKDEAPAFNRSSLGRLSGGRHR